MSRRGRWPEVLGALLLAGLALAAPAAAQILRPGSWSGSIEGSVEFGRSDTDLEGRSGSRFERLGGRQQLSLLHSGLSIIDPRLLTLTLGGAFGLSEERTTSDSATGGPRADFQLGTFYGYNASASLLSAMPYSADIFANRSQSILSRELSGRSEVITENRGVRLHGRGLVVPSTITLRQERFEDESRVAGQVARRDERRTIATWEGQRGWEDGEIDLRYEYIDSVDRINPALGYRSHEGAVGLGQDFGPELEWHWASRYRYFTRRGAARDATAGLGDFTTWNVDQDLDAEHSERLRSRYRYSLTHTETSGGKSTTHLASAGLTHQLYESLTTTGTVDGGYQVLEGGETITGRGRLDLAYRKRLPGGGRLTVGLGGSLEYEDDRFSSTETFVPGERLTFDLPFAVPLALRNPFVVLASVVVTRIATGPLPAGCLPVAGPPTPLVLGRDYTLRTVGDRTEIVPIPCTGATAGLNPGDTIAVDYRHEVAAALAFTTLTWRASVGIDYGWIRLYYSHDQSDQQLISGQGERFLEDRSADVLGVELRHDADRVSASLLGEAGQATSSREGQGYRRLRGAQRLTLRLTPDLSLNVNLDQAWVEFAELGRVTRSLFAEATVAYALNDSAYAEATGTYRWLRDSTVPEERTAEARLRVQWRIRKLEVTPTLLYIQREQGGVSSRELRATLLFVRRF